MRRFCDSLWTPSKSLKPTELSKLPLSTTLPLPVVKSFLRHRSYGTRWWCRNMEQSLVCRALTFDTHQQNFRTGGLFFATAASDPSRKAKMRKNAIAVYYVWLCDIGSRGCFCAETTKKVIRENRNWVKASKSSETPGMRWWVKSRFICFYVKKKKKNKCLLNKQCINNWSSCVLWFRFYQFNLSILRHVMMMYNQSTDR